MNQLRNREFSANHASPPAQPILGWRAERNTPNIGFHTGAHRPADDQLHPITDAGEGHLMTIAPTGAGKGRSVIIPTLLSYDGPVIVIDPKGENYDVTARRRREMGQSVFLLDPFGICKDQAHCFNPLELIDPTRPDAFDQARAMVELLMPGHAFLTDPFWETSAQTLIAAVALHVVAARPPVLKNINEVVYLFNQSMEDFGFTIKEMIKSDCEVVRQTANGYSGTEPKVMASILSTARAGLAPFASDSFSQMSMNTGLPIQGIIDGDDISIYLVLPPERLDTHGRFLRLWIGCLMDQICKRRHRVSRPTLFILDEAAQLGALSQLRRAVTLLRGYGLRTWSFWQDLSQLQRLYPDWQTLYNNTRYIQTFGATTHMLAESLAHLLRLPSDIDPLTLPCHQMILAEAHKQPRVVGKPDYLKDPHFHGLYDDNPFYQPPGPRGPEGEMDRHRAQRALADDDNEGTVLTLEQILKGDFDLK